MPNFDVWYPLGISATLYSIMTLWLAIKRVVKKLRRKLGLSPEAEETSEPRRQVRIEYPIAPITIIQPLEISTSTPIPKTNL